MRTNDLGEELIGRIYDEISAEKPWQHSLQALQNAVGAQTLVLQMSLEGEGEQSYFLAAGARTMPAHIHEWESRSRDQLISLALAPGRIETCNDYLRRRPREGFIELIRRYDVARGMSAHIVRRGDTSYSLHALRPGTSAPFGMAEERLFARLIPHLSRAIGLRADIVAASDRIAEHAAALDRCGLAMITLNKRERVITCNDRAEARLKGSGLRLDGKRLHADDHALAVRLGHAVTAALAAESSQDFRAAIPLQNGAFALVRATPRREPNLGRLIPAATILVASTPKPATGAADLRALFDLTPAAAEVALHLAIGSNAAEIQQTLGIRYTTLRTHMAQLFAKLDCESQSELVHRLATLLPILQ